MEYLSFSQVTVDEAMAAYITTMEVPDGTLNRITRMPFQFRKDDEPLKAYDVMIDELDEHNNLIGDSPVVIPPGKAIWLLKEFFHAPFKVVAKIKEPREVE